VIPIATNKLEPKEEKSFATVVEKKPYKGLSFTELEKFKAPIIATFAISPSEKLVMKGTLTVDVHKNSYAFQDEAVISLWSNQYPVVERRAQNDGYARIEIPIPVRDAYNFLLNVCMKLDARLKGVI